MILRRMYLGLPLLMRAPQERALPYTAVVVVCGVLVLLAIAALSGVFMPLPSTVLPGAPR